MHYETIFLLYILYIQAALTSFELMLSCTEYKYVAYIHTYIHRYILYTCICKCVNVYIHTLSHTYLYILYICLYEQCKYTHAHFCNCKIFCFECKRRNVIM